ACDLGAGPGYRGLDALLQLLWTWHIPEGTDRSNATITEAMGVTLTDIAASKVREFLNGQGEAGEAGLRVGVRGGGCSGFQYALALDEKRDDDHVFDASGIRVLVDPRSLRYVDAP